MIEFYLEADISPGHYFKTQVEDDKRNFKVTMWTSKKCFAKKFENSVEALHFASQNVSHAKVHVRQHVDYSDMWYG